MATAYPGGLRKRGLLDYEDTIQATPRNAFFGGVADLLGQAYKLPEMPRLGVPGLDFVAANRNRLMDLLGVGDVQKTAEAMAYGNRLGTGRGMTYQPLPETMGAAMALAPMVAPAARMVGEGAMATGRFVAPKAGQLAEQYMVNTGGILPLDVYHGTPHTLPPTPRNPLGEFDASKIGTGEGNQSFGHGIYTSEAPSVAKSYQGSVSAMHKAQGKSVADVTIQGKSIDWDDPVQVAAFELERHNGDRAAAAAFHAKTFAGGENNAAVKILKSKQQLPSVDLPGNLYKVDLPDEKIAQMLDWDKPLSEQSQYIQDAMTKIGMPLNKTGKEAYEGIGYEMGRKKGSTKSTVVPFNSAEAANFLQKEGVAGIKYFDQGSRNAEQGTRNFVVFPGEEKSMTILERNGQRAIDELKRLQAGGLLAP